MIYLIQIAKMIKDLDHFYDIFSDLSFEIEEMGWKPIDLIPDLLDNHFGLEMEDQTQIKFLTEAIMDQNNFRSIINLEKLRRGESWQDLNLPKNQIGK